MTPELFPVAQYWELYAGFAAFVLVLLLLDLGVFNRKPHAVSVKEATVWSGVWLLISLAFAAALYAYVRWQFGKPEIANRVGLEFLTGYLVEEALSVDNIFIFVVVFQYFRIPAKYQHRVLFYGILGALVFRGLFISLGSLLLRFQWVVYVFGALLIITGVRMAFQKEDGVDPENNRMMTLLRRYLPLTPKLDEGNFIVKRNDRWVGTPLLLTLLFLESTDILFAIDSVPAIFAITKEPFVVFSSNMMAILGLRSLYFLLANAVERFYLLKYGLAAVLVFVGIKMVWLDEFSIVWSLVIIAVLLGVSIGGSLWFPRKVGDERKMVGGDQ